MWFYGDINRENVWGAVWVFEVGWGNLKSSHKECNGWTCSVTQGDTISLTELLYKNCLIIQSGALVLFS